MDNNNLNTATNHPELSIKNKHVFLMTEDQELSTNLTLFLSDSSGCNIHNFNNVSEILVSIYNNPPDIILIDFRNQADETLKFCSSLKADNAFGHLPVVLILENESELIDLGIFDRFAFDDYLQFPFTNNHLLIRLNLILMRAMRELDANPLTHLPGNTSIIKEIEKLVASGKKYSICYTDLDNFKAYNDTYGFARGDEVIRITARILLNTIQSFEPANFFIGHIGGDDFVFIVSCDRVEQACNEVIHNFDMIIPTLYDPEDQKNGYIISRDRVGSIQKFPIISISIAVVSNLFYDIKHSGEISSIAANLKKLAKAKTGSAYIMDRRRR